MLVGALIVIAIFTIFAIVLLSSNPIKLFFGKKYYKRNITKKLYSIAKSHDFYLLNRVSLPIDAKVVIHFDHILFSNKYIYCIVDAYYDGHLNGKKEDLSWFYYSPDGKTVDHINNPCRLQNTRVDYFAAFIGASKEMVVPFLVVNDSCYIDSETLNEEPMLVHYKDLKKRIEKLDFESQVPLINPFELEKVVNKIYQKGVSKKD